MPPNHEVIHTFALFPTDFSNWQFEFNLKRNSSGKTWIYEHTPPPPSHLALQLRPAYFPRVYEYLDTSKQSIRGEEYLALKTTILPFISAFSWWCSNQRCLGEVFRPWIVFRQKSVALLAKNSIIFFKDILLKPDAMFTIMSARNQQPIKCWHDTLRPIEMLRV